MGIKCYCQCRLTEDTRSELGYSLTLLQIRQVTWKEISAALDLLGRNDLDDRDLCAPY
jgi:hypothetical protein